MKSARLACWVFSGLLSATSGVYAQNSITALNVSDTGNGATIIKVELAQPLTDLPAGAGFTLSTPPRIVLDFPDTANGLGKSIQDFAKGGVRSANIVQAGGRTRLVINLDQMLAYNTKIDDGNLSIVLQGNTAETDAGSTLHLAEAEQGEQKPMLLAEAGKQIGAEARVASGKAKKAIAKKAKTAAKKAVKPDARAIQAQREAEARAKAEQEARLRAEAEASKQAEARKQAEAEARKQAEVEARKQAEVEAREKFLRDADALVKNGKPAEAYTLLEPLEFERSGEVRFDYLLGIAALDSGKADKATLAFERVLAMDPNFAGARLDMARAYYQLGDLPRAKTEFERVLKQNPPETARVVIQKYLDAIAGYEQAKQTRITGYVEGVVGHDSNVNTGTGSSITVSSLSPALAALITGLTGNPNPQIPPSQLKDNYLGFAAGGEINHNLNANWEIYAGADLRQHGNMVYTPYDSLSTDGRVGVIYAEEKNAYKLTLTGGQAYSANSMRRDSLGVSAEWQHTFSPANQMNAFVQSGKNRAAGSPPTARGTDARTSGNTDQVIAGLGWLHVMADGKQAVFASAYTGKELDMAPVNIAPPDGSKRFDGLRVGGQAAITDQVDVLASLGWQHAVYVKPNAFIANNGNRDEYQYDLMVGANWRLDKLWSVKPQVAFSKKNSNLAIYVFDRTDVSLTVRRDFK